MIVTSRQRVENLLVDLYSFAEKPQKNYQPDTDTYVYDFNGKLGSLVDYQGHFWEQGSLQNSGVSIDIQYRDEKLACVQTEHGFIQPGSMPFWTDTYAFDCTPSHLVKPIADVTEIKIISPKWTEKDGVCDLIYSKFAVGKLSVAHATDETAGEVMNQLFDIVERSKNHAALVCKLRKLTLPQGVKLKNLNAIANYMVDNLEK